MYIFLFYVPTSCDFSRQEDFDPHSHLCLSNEILFFNFKAIKGVEKIADEEEKRIASEINNSITNKFKNEKFNTEAAQSTQKPIR